MTSSTSAAAAKLLRAEWETFNLKGGNWPTFESAISDAITALEAQQTEGRKCANCGSIEFVNVEDAIKYLHEQTDTLSELRTQIEQREKDWESGKLGKELKCDNTTCHATETGWMLDYLDSAQTAKKEGRS